MQISSHTASQDHLLVHKSPVSWILRPCLNPPPVIVFILCWSLFPWVCTDCYRTLPERWASLDCSCHLFKDHVLCLSQELTSRHSGLQPVFPSFVCRRPVLSDLYTQRRSGWWICPGRITWMATYSGSFLFLSERWNDTDSSSSCSSRLTAVTGQTLHLPPCSTLVNRNPESKMCCLGIPLRNHWCASLESSCCVSHNRHMTMMSISLTMVLMYHVPFQDLSVG